jgi:hypothetical protein
LSDHTKEIVSIDFTVVPTARFTMLAGFAADVSDNVYAAAGGSNRIRTSTRARQEIG